MPTRHAEFKRAFSNLKELQINATLTTWANVRLLTSYMPRLQLLETGYNQLRHLLTNGDIDARDGPGHSSHLAVINFDSNELTDWCATCEALRPFVKYVRASVACVRLIELTLERESADYNDLCCRVTISPPSIQLLTTQPRRCVTSSTSRSRPTP